MTNSESDPMESHSHRRPESIYIKRIAFAQSDSCFQGGPVVAKLNRNEWICDVPAEGTAIRRGDPICTLIRQVESDSIAPMRRHRQLLHTISRRS